MNVPRGVTVRKKRLTLMLLCYGLYGFNETVVFEHNYVSLKNLNVAVKCQCAVINVCVCFVFLVVSRPPKGIIIGCFEIKLNLYALSYIVLYIVCVHMRNQRVLYLAIASEV